MLKHITMLPVDFSCVISSHDILAYIKELYSVDIQCEISTSTMSFSPEKTWVSAACQAIPRARGGSNMSI